MAGAAVLLVGCAEADSGGDAAPTASPTKSAEQPAAAPTDEIERSIDIGGRSLELRCEGTGSPTVILEAGLGGDLRTWEQVQPVLAETTRTCSYNRAGLGGSDPADTPRTAGDAVGDARAMLEAAGIAPPYVMVGFSFGGLITQLHASLHPEDVAGLVLVESNSPQEIETFEAHLTAAQIREDREFVLENPEGMDPYRSAAEVEDTSGLPPVPLVVISAGVSEGWPPGWDPALFDRLWRQLQSDLAESVPDGRQVIAEDSSHDIPAQAPATVVEAVREVLATSGGTS